MSYELQSIAGTSKKNSHSTGAASVSSGLLRFAEAAAGRLDQPAESSLDWTEPADDDEGISPGDCYPPDEVILGLEWLQHLAESADTTAQDLWREEWGETGPYSPKAFLEYVGPEIGYMLDLCRRAKARREKLILVYIES